MKTDKLLQLIQQKKVMRSGGALPLPKAKTGIAEPCPPGLVKNAKGECVLQVINPNDPRLISYRDSLSLYNDSKRNTEYFRKLEKDNLRYQVDEPTSVRGDNKYQDIKLYPHKKIKPEGYFTDKIFNIGLTPAFKKPVRKVELIEPPLEPIPLRKIDLTESMKLFNEDSDDLDAQLKTNFTPVNTELNPPITETTNTPPPTYNYPEGWSEMYGKRRKPKYYKHKQKEGPGWLRRRACKGDDCFKFAEGGSLPKAQYAGTSKLGVPEVTKLTPAQEIAYQRYKQSLGDVGGDEDYDLRGFWKEEGFKGLTDSGKNGVHFTDQYKILNFDSPYREYNALSDESKYASEFDRRGQGYWAPIDEVPLDNRTENYGEGWQFRPYKQGGSLPKAQSGNSSKSPKVNIDNNVKRSYFDSKSGDIYLNVDDIEDPSILEHEKYHYNQWLQNRLRTPDWYFDPTNSLANEEETPLIFTGNIPLQQPSMLTTQSWDAELPYYNRRPTDDYLISSKIIKNNPSFQFVPHELIYNGVRVPDSNPANPTHTKRILGTDTIMYDQPWTAEGEAQAYQNAYRDDMTTSPEEYDKMLTEGFKKGGSLPKAQAGKPIYVTDPNDPRLKAYNDSLSLYNGSVKDLNKFYKTASLKPGPLLSIQQVKKIINNQNPSQTFFQGPSGRLNYGKYNYNSNSSGAVGSFSKQKTLNEYLRDKSPIKPIGWRPELNYGQKYNPNTLYDYTAEYQEPVQKVILQKEDEQKIERPAFDFSVNEDVQPIAPTPYVPNPVRRVMNPAFNFNVDFLPNRTKEAVVDELGNPRYKYYNGDKVITEQEYKKLMQKKSGGSLPKAQDGITVDEDLPIDPHTGKPVVFNLPEIEIIGKRNKPNYTNVRESTAVNIPKIKDPVIKNVYDSDLLDADYAVSVANKLLKDYNVKVDSTGNILKDVGLPSSAYYNPITRTINYNSNADNSEYAKRKYFKRVVAEIPHAIQADRMGTIPFLVNIGIDALNNPSISRYRQKGTLENEAHRIIQPQLEEKIDEAALNYPIARKQGGSLPKHQWVTSQVLSQPGPTKAKANFVNSSSLGMATQNAGNILNAIMSNKKNQPFVNFIDKRVIDPVVKGKKLEETRRHTVKGVNREELDKMINQAKLVGADPATLITTAIWESNMGQTDPNLVHDLHESMPTVEGLDDFSARANMAAQALNRQLKLGIKKYPQGPFYKQMQSFQGYGPLYPNTEEDYYGHTNQAFFGIPVTRQNPLRTNVIFPYGKTIENFRDSVVIPTLEQYGIKYKEKGGSLPKAQKGLPSKWMRVNTGLANFKGTTLDEKADAERKKKEKEEFVKKQQEEDQKQYGVEAWKTGKTIEQLKDEENESLNNYYKTQQRGWELEDGAPFRETGIKLANGKYIPSDTELGFKTPEALAEGVSNPFNWPGLALSAIGAWEAGAPVLGAVNSALSVPVSTVATFGNSAALPWLTGNTLLGAYGASQIPGNLRRGEYGWAALNSLPVTAPLLGAGFRGAKNVYNTIAGESGLFSKFKVNPPIQAAEYTVPEPVEFYPNGFNLKKSFKKVRPPKRSVEAEPLTDKLVLEKNPSRLENVDEYIGTRRELKKVVDPSTNESISLKSWIDENGNVRYYFSSQMPSNSYNAGKSYYALDKFIPKNSTIAEPPGGSLSFDSFINTVKRTKNSKFKSSLLEGSEGIRLNNQSVKNKLPFSGDIGDGYYSSLDEAQKVADEINGFIKDYNLPKATVTQHPYDGSYQIMLPHISLEKLYKKGGELTSQKAAEMLQDGTANGKPLTDKQKRYFGYIANKNKRNG